MPERTPPAPRRAPGRVHLALMPLAALTLAVLAVGVLLKATGWTRLVLGFTLVVPLWIGAVWVGLWMRDPRRMWAVLGLLHGVAALALWGLA
ncbi:hypothetical protein [Mesoterricola sediminis]|uniref:Uncharacterized protein n=1 Tax=Mesoterricola sediminis TaxID=2927980 RepID=A0AA48KHH9_9BACT|nr:hypothetical protein [Mesoterricola sediminis]BDU78398.1 hypothetical protein METESE_33560 [Mesoterricola sediminis]